MARHLVVFLAVLALGALIAASAGKGPAHGPSPGGGEAGGKTYTIELGENGFTPSELAVDAGDTVLFVNKNPRVKFSWPASDAHPTHQLYPEFDPGAPVPSGQPWVFTFERAGTWGYHDHLAPYFTGRITVREGTVTQLGDCSPGASSREACWNLTLTNALQEEGAAGAFRELVRLYRTEPTFIADGCHRQAHVIGEAAYAEYRRHGDWSRMNFGPETIYCNYGYYHGIFEHLFRDHPGDFQLVKNLCAELEAKLSRTIPRIRQNCYHGAGHGFMAEPPSAGSWGNAQSMLGPALRSCDALGVPPEEQEECYQGVFNVLADWMNFTKYGLYFPEPNLLRVCEDQSEKKHRLACYYEFGMRIHDAAGNDIRRIAETFVNAIADDETAKMVMDSAASTVIESTLSRSNYDELLAACHALAERLQGACINGLLGGLVAHGEPGREYKKALQLCASPRLPEEQRPSCYRHLFGKFRQVYLTDEIRRLCRTIPARYQKSCDER